MLSWLSPDPHLELVDVSPSSDSLIFTVQSTRSSASCPECQKNTSRIHSRYARSVQNLPVSGQPVKLLILSKKWFYDQPDCSVRIFTERYEGIPAKGRRTSRTEDVLRKMAFSTICLTAEKVAHGAHIPVSHDTLLAIVQRTEINPEVSPFPRSG
ncbi:transposase [Bacillus sp. Soil768D1]|nr:transposase [Bacillus sp. Soil768D1]